MYAPSPGSRTIAELALQVDSRCQQVVGVGVGVDMGVGVGVGNIY